MKRLFFLLFLTVLGTNSYGVHILGGEISYELTSSDATFNYYTVIVNLYRDCEKPNGVDNDGRILIVYDLDQGPVNTAYSYLNSGYTANPTIYQMDLPTVYEVDNIFDSDPCIDVSSVNVCMERDEYIIYNLALRKNTRGYVLSHQRCCRQDALNNLITPGEQGANYWTQIPGTATLASMDNSGPKFKKAPPVIVCNGFSYDFDFSATDADGDRLEYEFYNLTHAGTTTETVPGLNNTMPVREFPNPSFTNVRYQNGYTYNNPLGNSGDVSIDRNSGVMTIAPEALGIFVIGVKVSEFRNGVKISETIRDYAYKVVDCKNNNLEISSDFGEPEFYEGCSEATITFKRGVATDEPLTITYNFVGDASLGDDFNSSNPTSVTIPANGTEAELTLTPIADDVYGENQQIIIQINDLECVSEGSDDTIRLIDSQPIDISLSDVEDICYGSSETARLELDGGINGGYEPSGYNYSWNTGDVGTAIEVSPEEDTEYTLTVTDNCNSEPGVATVTVPVHEQLSILSRVLNSPNDELNEPCGELEVRVERTAKSFKPRSIDLRCLTGAGIAESGADYTGAQSRLDFGANGNPQTFVLTPVEDGYGEGDESVVMEIDYDKCVVVKTLRETIHEVKPLSLVVPDGQTLCYDEEATVRVEIDGGINSFLRWSTGETTEEITRRVTQDITLTATLNDECFQTPVEDDVTIEVRDNARIFWAESSDEIFEGCENGDFIIERSGSLEDAETITINVGGSATSDDYQTISQQVSFAAGQSQATVTLNPIADTEYGENEDVQLTITDHNCVTEPLAVATLVDVPPLSGEIDFNGDDCPLEGLLLTAKANGGYSQDYFYKWDDGSEEASFVFTPTTNGTHKVEVTVTDDCNAEPVLLSAEIPVDCKVKVPDYLTPGDDNNINDFFYVSNLEFYPESTLQVFSRWGDLVYQSNNYQNDWDGINQRNNKELSGGTYYFILSVKGDQVYKGPVTLFR